MAHEGRGDIDQEKKGRPGLSDREHRITTPVTASRPHDWLAAAGDACRSASPPETYQ